MLIAWFKRFLARRQRARNERVIVLSQYSPGTLDSTAIRHLVRQSQRRASQRWSR